jgi:hypothetical protein
MDFLHYMRFEQENFSLIVAPLLCDAASWALNERSEDGYIDFMLATWNIAERFCLMGFFVWNLFRNIRDHQYFYWKIAYGVLMARHITNVVLDFTLARVAGKNAHQNVRVATNQNEMVALTILILHNAYLIGWLFRDKQKRLQKKSTQIIYQR